MKSGIAISVLSLMIFFAACNKTEIVPIEKDPCLLPDSLPTYYYNGVYRQYILYRPDSLPANAPLLFVLHGEQHNAEKMYQIGFNKQADTNKFMVCYPQALKCNWENSSRKTTDVAFLKILAQYLQTKYGLSTTKTYAVGYSSGGTMSNLLAIDGGEVFKATACVAGNLKTEIVDNSFPQYAIPTFTIHGTSDEVMPINGSVQNRTPSTQRVVDLFRKTNNCFAVDTIKRTDSTTALIYKDTTAFTKEVWYYIIRGQGHEFPGDIYTKSTKDVSGFDGCAEIWKFLNKW